MPPSAAIDDMLTASRSDIKGDKLKRTLSGFIPALTSVPSLTFIILMLMEIWLRQGNPVDAMSYHNVDTWDLPNKYAICRRCSPDLALIGSSLLLVLNQKKDDPFMSAKVSPPYFQAELSKATGQNITCLNMCTGMQMVSEGYMIVRAMANQPNHPAAVIFGTAMRDFMYEPLRNESSTGTFISSAPYAPMQPDVLSVMSSYSAVQDFLLSHYWYLYRNRTDFAHIGSAVCKNLLEYLPLDRSYERISFDHDFEPRRDGFLWEEWVPRKHLEKQWKRNPQLLKNLVCSEHHTAFGEGSEFTRQVEAKYFEAMCDFCRSHSIKLVVINMPLASEIASIAPAGLNDAFRQYLKVVTKQYDVKLIDLEGDPEFPSEAFIDGAHLKYDYAVKFADRIVNILHNQYPDVLAAMAEHAQSRARDPKLKAVQEAPFKN